MNEQPDVPPPPSGFDTVLSFFEALSSFAILVAVASLAFAAWTHRRTRRAIETQGLIFDTGESSIVRIVNGETGTTTFEPSATATGPGVRYRARTMFWTDDNLMEDWMWNQQVCGRFEVGEDAMRGEVVIPVDLTAQVWFGIAWDTVAGRGIRTEFVRINLRTGKMQRWKWYRFLPLHRWWCEQGWLRVVGGGKREQAGRWESVSGDTTPEWQFPT